LAKLCGRDACLEKTTTGVLALVTTSALSGEYWPGPIPSPIFSGRFSPIVNDMTSSPNFLGES
jgi:hypothetical protein